MNIWDKTDNLRVMMKEACLELKEVPKQEKKILFSEATKDILEKRGEALERGEEENYDRLTKEFRKSKAKDKREGVIKTIAKELDIRERWAGIRRLKSKYQPQPYNRTDKHSGMHIHMKQRAEKAAEYLSKEQWGKKETKEEEDTRREKMTRRRIIPKEREQYRICEIELWEIKAIIKRLKRRKAAGPDEIPVELLKELGEEGLWEIRNVLNEWWNAEEIPEEQLRARVVLIYKKGDTSKFENYRPISLLSTLYKLFAAILQRRIAAKLDKHLQKTQFGFRRNKGTADAVYLVRRIAEFGEKTTKRNDPDPLIMVLLDWEKAFDKVDREGMFLSMERLGVDDKLIRMVKLLYKETFFNIEIDGERSSWKEQLTGIRQGCPLSPYLFLIVMTAIFNDVHTKLGAGMAKGRVPGADFDEVMYADDTICISTDTRWMNKMLAEIEMTGRIYGLKLNKNKCEVMKKNTEANVHFGDGTKVPSKEEVVYLGCTMNQQTDYNKEIGKRIQTCMATLKKLDIFWLHSDCPARVKVITLDAVIRAKLLYGMESAKLGETELKRLDKIHLKAMRKY